MVRSLRAEQSPGKSAHNLKVVQEPDRGEVHGKLVKNNQCGRMEELFQPLRKNLFRHLPSSLLVVRRVKAHVTGESRKQLKDKVGFNTEGSEKADELADELAKLGADMDKARRAESLAREMQDEREKVKDNKKKRTTSK